MTKLRTRGAPVDYTDFLSPAAKALPGRGGKRKAWDEEENGVDPEDAEEEEEEEVVVVKKKKKQTKNAAAVVKKPKTSNAISTKRKEEEDFEEELEEGRAAGKPKTKTKAKTNQRPAEVDEDKPEPKPKAKKAASKERDVQYETAAVAVVATATATSKTSRRVERTAVATSAPVKMQELRQKYEALREFRESETARLLREATDLAKEEKRTYEKLVAKLKGEVAALSSRAQQAQIDHKTRVEELQTEHKLRVETLKREREDSVAANERLRRQIKELEAEAKRVARGGGGRQAISRADAAAVARTGDISVELSQAKKLLELYRLVTSTELRLIETLDDDDDQEPENYTDVACAVVDSVTGKRFTFDLAVPHDAKEEVEYVPSETPSAAFKTPSYLQEELSFKRSELTKFMRTLLDVVIRKKAADGAKR